MTDSPDSDRGTSLTAWPPNANCTVTSISTEPTRAVSVARKEALPLEGDVVGESYRLVVRLGEGMFGRVYIAERTDVPEHRVALKVISRAMYAGRNVERELVMLAAASHPHVVQLKDHGMTDDYIWLTMPLYEGETLAERLERGPLSLRQAHDIFVPIARGLASLHQRGMRHQDVKPENIYLARFADQIHPVLLDLGVAVEHDSSFVAGTVLYCSPEQVTALGGIAGAAQLSAKMDTYCLATTLLRSLTSEEEFDPEPADTPLKMANQFELREQEPLGESLELMSPSARQKLQAAFQQWFNRDPSDRPDTAAMARQLDVLLEEERLAAEAIEKALLAQKNSLRRVRVALATMALAGLGAGLWGYSKRKTLQLATALQKAKAAGAASFDKLDTCVAAQKLTQLDHRQCQQSWRSEKQKNKRNVDIIVTANNLERRSLNARYDGVRTTLRSCEEQSRKNQQGWDKERSTFQSQQAQFERTELAWKTERKQLQTTQSSLEASIRTKSEQWSRERQGLRSARDDARNRLQTAATRIASLASENTNYQSKLSSCTKERNICMVEATRQRRPRKASSPARADQRTSPAKRPRKKSSSSAPTRKQPPSTAPKAPPAATKGGGKAGPSR